MSGFDANVVRDVLDFWFGAEDTYRREWFVKDAAFDATIRERFGALIDDALHAPDADDAMPAEAVLARILVLDQFTRNVFRDTPRAFAGDTRAVSWALRLVARGADPQLPVLRRAFVYLPFEHAESRALQALSVRCFARLADTSPALADMHDYALRHRDVVARFGRFPHRNEILGRASTAAEAAFLREPGSRF